MSGRGKPIPPKNRRIVEERCGGVCEGCGKQPATNLHHRLYRSRGGGNEVSNLIALCGMGNAAGCHQIAHSGEGVELGWSCNSWTSPTLTPVLYRGVMSWLTDQGRVEPLDNNHQF
jgi:hypothetical protein